MQELEIAPVTIGSVEMKASGTTVYFSGSINHPKPGDFMEPFIRETHDAIVGNNIREIRVDITKLRFLNSAGIRELVDWVMKLGSLPEDLKYRMQFVCNPEYKWQESSMATLIYLNPGYLSKVTVRKEQDVQ
jgi:hypothetical protein